jgi:hypothetical protein
MLQEIRKALYKFGKDLISSCCDMPYRHPNPKINYSDHFAIRDIPSRYIRY